MENKESGQGYKTIKIGQSETILDNRGVIRGAGTVVKVPIKKEEVKDEL